MIYIYHHIYRFPDGYVTQGHSSVDHVLSDRHRLFPLHHKQIFIFRYNIVYVHPNLNVDVSLKVDKKVERVFVIKNLYKLYVI